MSVCVSVLAAGQGTRMRSEWPKVLHELAGWPMVRHVLETARQVADFAPALVVGYQADLVRQTLGDGDSGAIAAGHRWRYVLQEQQLGTGHALLQCEGVLAGLADNVLALVGDVPLIRPETLWRMVKRHQEVGATVTVLTFTPDNVEGYGRIMRDSSGRVLGIVEDKVATDEQKSVREVNSGILCFRDDWVWPALKSLRASAVGEYFLTDLVAVAVQQGLHVEGVAVDDPLEVMGVDDRVKLAAATRALRERLNDRWMRAGVTIADPAATYLEMEVELGQDTVILPNTHVQGATRIGRRCVIGPNSVIANCDIGDDCCVKASFAEQAVLEDGVHVGPFAHLRSGAHLARGVHMGNFGEVKKSYLGPGTKMGHFSYVGDAVVGANVNIGAGTVTCNYDGKRKNKTVIGDRAFIGSDTMLIAPVEIGAGARIGAGSVVTHDVPPGSVAYGVPARVRGQVEHGEDSEP